MATSTLKTTSSHSCGITEEVLEVTEKPSEEAKNQKARSITRTTYTVSDPHLAATVLPSPYSLAPPGVATRLTSKFVYDCPTNTHRRQVIKRPMRVSSHSANAINLSFFQEQFSSATGTAASKPDDLDSIGSVANEFKSSKIESEESDEANPLRRLDSGLPQKGIDFCSDIEKAIVKEINKVRHKPRSYMIELANRRRELIGSTMWTRRSGAVRLTEGSAAIEEAMNALRTVQTVEQTGMHPSNSMSSPQGSVIDMGALKAPIVGGSEQHNQHLNPPRSTISPKSRPKSSPQISIAEMVESDSDGVESLSSDDNSEYVRGSSSDEDNTAVTPTSKLTKGRGTSKKPQQTDFSSGDDEIEPDVDTMSDKPSFLRVESNSSSFRRGGTHGKSLSMLNVSTGLCLAARDHAKDIGPKGLTTHRGTVDESSVRERVERYGVWLESCYEMLSFGVVDAVDLVCQLLIDDGIPGRHHRNLLMSNRFGDMGVHVAPHAVFGVVVVIVFAGRFLTLKKSVMTQLNVAKDMTRRQSFASGLSSISGPLEEGVATCPQCKSAVAKNQCVYGPWGEAYHRHCLRCHQCFSTIQNGYYMYDFDLMAPHLQRAGEGFGSAAQSQDWTRSPTSGSASALRSAVLSARTSISPPSFQDGDTGPSSPHSSTSTSCKPKADIAPLCPPCYNRLNADRCVVCGVSCAFPNPLRADKMASFHVNQSPACEECFLNEAVTMQAVSKGLKKVRR